MTIVDSPHRSNRRRRIRPAVLVLLVAACATASPLSAPAAVCDSGRNTPRASGIYRCEGRIQECDRPLIAHSVGVKARIRNVVLYLGSVVSDTTETHDIGNVSTDIDGRFLMTFDWCHAIQPHVPPSGGILFQVVSTQEVFVEVKRGGGAIVWTSPRIDLATTNVLRFDRNTSGSACSISPVSPTVAIEAPNDGEAFVVPLCPVRPCILHVPFTVDIRGPRAIYRVSYEVFDSGGTRAFEGGFCRYDPIENQRCGTPPLLLEKSVGLGAGDWTVVVTAMDEQGLTGQDAVAVTLVEDPTEIPGPTSIASVDPMVGSPPIEVRGGFNPKTAGATVINLAGENLHRFLRIYLSPRSTSLFPYEWVLYPVEEFAVRQDGTLLRFTMPPLPERTPVANTPGAAQVDTFLAFWRIVIYDDFIRPGRVAMMTIPPVSPTPAPEDYFDVARPAYPYIHGFGFANAAQDARFDQFLAVFGDNAYICGGPVVVGNCIGLKLPDPLYWFGYWWVFRSWVNGSKGSCVGMSATSLMLHDGDLAAQDFGEDVYFPAGFSMSDYETEWDYPILGRAFGPPRPANLWAWIRRNHGVQTSGEFVSEYLDDLELDGFGFRGNPNAILAEIRDEPLGQVICMASNSDGGHCVTPYGAKQRSVNLWDIEVYDNNNPEDPKRIEIDTFANTFELSHRASDYSGTVIVTAPKELFLHDVHMPGLGNVLDLVFLVLGDAEPEVTTDQGRWGWDEEGEFRSELPGLRAVYPMNGLRSGNPLMVLPRDADPTVIAHAKGGDYLFHAASDRHLLQVEVQGRDAGVSDSAALLGDGERLRSLRFASARSGGTFVPRVGMATGERESVLFIWSGLSPAEGGDYGFTALSETRGVEYENHSSLETRHTLVLHAVDGPSETTGVRLFGPFDVPAGAHHRTTIVDWPESMTVLSELDLDGDGVPEESREVTATPCGTPGEATEDLDRNGIPDRCQQVGTLFLRGDSNADGRLDLSDAIATLAWLFQDGSSPPTCQDAADTNDDGDVDISDPIILLGFLFLGAPPPPAPGTSCGVDPTDDDGLSCDAYDACP